MGLNIILRLLPSVNFQKFVLDITSINGFPDCSQDVLTQVTALTRTSSLWIWSFLLVHTDPVRACPLVTVSLEVTLARQGLISESTVWYAPFTQLSCLLASLTGYELFVKMGHKFITMVSLADEEQKALWLERLNNAG